MKKYALLFLIFPLLLTAQTDSKFRYQKIKWTGDALDLPKQSLLVKSIVPLTLTGAAFAINGDQFKMDLQTKILKPFDGYSTSLDDYIQYAPIVELYAFDMLKFKARNSVWNQTKFLIISEAVTSGIVHLLKNTLKVQRPDNSSFTSFPSGHTSQAFVASQVLFNEYYQTNKLIGLSGYLFSGATGALRVINNRHWVPDVLLGAGIAILVTNTVYHFEPLKNWNPWKKKNNDLSINFIPSLQNNNYSGTFLMTF